MGVDDIEYNDNLMMWLKGAGQGATSGRGEEEGGMKGKEACFGYAAVKLLTDRKILLR